MKRTHHCNELRPANIGQIVTLSGWVHSRRDLGGLIFIDIRDREGRTQTVFDPSDLAKELFEQAAALRSECVINVTGKVRQRPEGTNNAKIPTGEVEIAATALEVLNVADVLPFPVDDPEVSSKVNEELRLKYRYLDLRRPEMARNLRLRSKVATATRVPGIMMMPALAWLAWQNVQPTERDRLGATAGLILAASGFGAYCAYIYHLTGNPFEWAATLQRWGYFPGGAPWMAPVNLVRQLATHPYRYLTTDPMAPYDTLYGVTGILFVLAIPFVWRQFGAAYGLFMLLNLWLPLSSGVFEGVGRYCSVLFPCFIWLASIRSPVVSDALLVGFALFYTLGLALFTTIHPLF
jgi:hypothetical protein